jgi:hypothetical protein
VVSINIETSCPRNARPTDERRGWGVCPGLETFAPAGDETIEDEGEPCTAARGDGRYVDDFDGLAVDFVEMMRGLMTDLTDLTRC